MAFPPNDVYRIEIFPPISVARLGDSAPSTFYLGPDVPDIEPIPSDGKFKDPDGKIKRQAAHFHAYAFKQDGTTLGEIKKTDGYTLTWTVNVANKKAAWVKFRGKVHEETYNLRNPTIQPYKPGPTSGSVYDHTETRDKLIINATNNITSSDTSTKPLTGSFDGGLGRGRSITLGHLRVDEKGSLIFIAGDGDSRCVAGAGEPSHADLTEYFDSQYWYDCTCDGHVTLSVAHNSWPQPKPAARKATITTAPPKFTPGLTCVTSLYDLMEDIYERPKRSALGTTYDCGEVDYYVHIKPIFHGLSLMSWTNQKVYEGHGPHKLSQFNDDLLKNNSDGNKPIRQAIFDRLRAPVKPNDPQDPYIRTAQSYEYYMPRLAGNAGDNPESLTSPTNNRDRWASLTELQYNRLSKWAQGRFSAVPRSPIRNKYDHYPPLQQPLILSRAALQFTTGAPLYPGIEAYWIAESSDLYEPRREHDPIGIFRFNESVKPGDLTKGLSLPWQADFFMWPNVRPDEIITMATFNNTRTAVANDSVLPRYLTMRELWHRGFRTHETDERVGATEMVKKWSKLGFVSKVSGITSLMDIYVETERNLT